MNYDHVAGYATNWATGHVARAIAITSNMMHYEGVPVISYYVITEFASVPKIFGAAVLGINSQVLKPIQSTRA